MFLSDNETKTDLLYYEAIAGSITALIGHDQTKPISIGIHGDWGAGKSSLLMMIEESLAADKTVVCLRFNGWQFQGFDDAKTVLLESIVEGLERARPFTGDAKAAGRSLLKSIRQRIDWLKLGKKAGGFLLSLGTGLPIGSAVEYIVDKVGEAIGSPGANITADGVADAINEAGECLKDEKTGTSVPKQMHEFQKEFEELIVAAKISRLVILIDDLDRCLPETAIETLEAAKLFLSLPRVAFVIAADEGMIEYAVKRHFPELPLGASYARNYLEKLIQVPFRIPSMGLTETRLYIALLLVEAATSTAGDDAEQVFEKLRAMARGILRRPWERDAFDQAELKKYLGETVPASVKDAIAVSEQLAEQLTDGTKGNPRQIKRFVNSLLLRVSVAESRGFGGEIIKPYLAKIMLAERFWPPGAYDQFAQEVAAARDGKPASLANLEAGKSAVGAEGADQWTSQAAVKVWAAKEPHLATIDLRPYLMLTRDRRIQFSVAGGKFDELVERLSANSPAVLATTTEDVKRLTADDAQMIFDRLIAKIRGSDSYKTMPSGALGLGKLAESHVSLQKGLVRFAADIPVSKLGSWIIAESKWEVAITDAGAKREWSGIKTRWSEQTENKELAVVLRALGKSRKK